MESFLESVIECGEDVVIVRVDCSSLQQHVLILTGNRDALVERYRFLVPFDIYTVNFFI